MSDANPSARERVAWAILQALHAHLPEDTRPMSWSDLSDEQAERIRQAASAAMSETMVIYGEINEILAK